MGPNHITLKDGGAIREMCSEANPLANLKRMPLVAFQVGARSASALALTPTGSVECAFTCSAGIASSCRRANGGD
jgi:hypothetical protein